MGEEKSAKATRKGHNKMSLAKLERALRKRFDETDDEHITLTVVPGDLGGLAIEIADDNDKLLGLGQGKSLSSAVADALDDMAHKP